MKAPKYGVIEGGIPIPTAHTGKGTGLAATLRAMKVGDSCLLPVTMRDGIYTAAKYNGIQIAVRKVDTSSMRVWRTK